MNSLSSSCIPADSGDFSDWGWHLLPLCNSRLRARVFLSIAVLTWGLVPALGGNVAFDVGESFVVARLSHEVIQFWIEAAAKRIVG